MIAQNKQGLWVYPNPAYNNIQVMFKVAELNAQNSVNLTDVLGKIIETKTYNHLNGSVTFNTTTLANGTYFVTLVSNGKVLSTQKIIINH